jgi:uncharacterized membrane protein YcaP (DUF421 family)
MRHDVDKKGIVTKTVTVGRWTMFDIDLPWWEFVLRGAIVYCALLVLVRVSGKRTVGQFTPFDLLVVMLLSESVSNSLSGGDDSITGGLPIAGTLVALNILIAVLSARNPNLAKIIDGECTLIGRDGKIFDDVAKRSHIAKSDIYQALREADVELDEARCIFLEADGTLTVLKKKD